MAKIIWIITNPAMIDGCMLIGVISDIPSMTKTIKFIKNRIRADSVALNLPHVLRNFPVITHTHVELLFFLIHVLLSNQKDVHLCQANYVKGEKRWCRGPDVPLW